MAGVKNGVAPNAGVPGLRPASLAMGEKSTEAVAPPLLSPLAAVAGGSKANEEVPESADAAWGEAVGGVGLAALSSSADSLSGVCSASAMGKPDTKMLIKAGGDQLGGRRNNIAISKT